MDEQASTSYDIGCLLGLHEYNPEIRETQLKSPVHTLFITTKASASAISPALVTITPT